MTETNHNHQPLPVSVRNLRKVDVFALQKHCWPQKDVPQVRQRMLRMLELQESGQAWPCVGLYRDVVVGYGQLSRWLNTIEISYLVVAQGWRSHGVGTAIITHLAAEARQLGYQQVDIGVARNNTRARTLYTRLGFRHNQHTRMVNLGQGMEPVIYISRVLNEPDSA